MPALFHHATGVDDEDAIGAVDRGEAVRHDDDRPIMRDPLQGGDDGGLGRRVQGRRGLVQNEDRRIPKDGPRDRDTLALAARQQPAQLARRGVIAPGETRDQVVDLGGSGRGSDLGVRRVRLPHSDVVAHGSVEEEGILEHDPDLRVE